MKSFHARDENELCFILENITVKHILNAFTPRTLAEKSTMMKSPLVLHHVYILTYALPECFDTILAAAESKRSSTCLAQAREGSLRRSRASRIILRL
jgi:hypothetical protein